MKLVSRFRKDFKIQEDYYFIFDLISATCSSNVSSLFIRMLRSDLQNSHKSANIFGGTDACWRHFVKFLFLLGHSWRSKAPIGGVLVSLWRKKSPTVSSVKLYFSAPVSSMKHYFLPPVSSVKHYFLPPVSSMKHYFCPHSPALKRGYN